MLIRGTKKLLTELRVPPLTPLIDVPSDSALGVWYGNIIRIDRHKCMAFTDETTLFTFFIPKVTRKQYSHFQDLFLDALCSALLGEFITMPDAIQNDEIEFGTTRDRRVLSSLNDLVLQFKYYVAAAGGLEQVNLREVHRLINETPMSLIKDNPVTALRRQLGDEEGRLR